jgi:putative oxidoreductase
MFKKLLTTSNESGLLVIRLVLAIMIFAHGAQKLLGWWGGYGFEGTMGFFTQTMGIPWIFGFAAIVTEFFGGILLALGMFSRLWAAAIGVVMAVAVFTVHLPNGFFMNWGGSQKGEGIEFFILAIGIAAALVIQGGGKWAVDSLLANKLTSTERIKAENRHVRVNATTR